MTETNPASQTTSENSDKQLEAEIQAALGDDSVEDLVNASVEAQQQEAAPAASNESDSAESKTGQQRPAPRGGRQESIVGKVWRGRIQAVSGDDVLVELAGVQGKNTGIVPGNQFDRPPRAGAIMDFVVNRLDEKEGLYILSREGAVGAATWDQIHPGTNVEARVTGTNKGGLELELVGSIRAFMPASQIDIHHVDDMEALVGQKLQAAVQEVDRKRKQVLLSRRQYIEQERARNQEKLLAELKEGDIVEGTVSSLMDYGAFVDCGGMDGLLHISDMSHAHINKPAEVVSVGSKVQVKVLQLDKEKKRLKLGLKQIQPDPWEGVDSKYRAGDQVTGRVVRHAQFGIFLELEPGLEGLIPASEVSWRRSDKPSDIAKEGDMLRVKVLDVDPEKKRLSLSLKQSAGDPWTGAESKYARNTVLEARVISTTDFGAFVEIEPGIEGLIHISELSDKRVNQVTDVVKVGDQVKLRVLEVDEDERRIKLSKKYAEKSLDELPPEEAPQAPAKKKAKRQKPGNLTGGIGSSGGLGMGLGDLKL